MAKKSIKRCKKTDTDNFGKKKAKVAVPAKVACPVACNAACGGGGLLACEVYDIVDAVDAYLADADAAEATYGGPIGEWDVSCVTDMDEMFQNAEAFNGAIDAWDVSSVTNLFGMFSNAYAFDQDLGWCVGTSVNTNYAFLASACAATSCGVTQSSSC